LPASKKIMVTVPESLLLELDNIYVAESKNRSEVIREALKLYLGERKRRLVKEQMKKGYLEMADINLTLASESIPVEHEALVNCLEKLTE
jgi:CopG family transcriptional regulator/antitoxin EndoAI